jgi:hypothetical protein
MSYNSILKRFQYRNSIICIGHVLYIHLLPSSETDPVLRKYSPLCTVLNVNIYCELNPAYTHVLFRSRVIKTKIIIFVLPHDLPFLLNDGN